MDEDQDISCNLGGLHPTGTHTQMLCSSTKHFFSMQVNFSSLASSCSERKLLFLMLISILQHFHLINILLLLLQHNIVVLIIHRSHERLLVCYESSLLPAVSYAGLMSEHPACPTCSGDNGNFTLE